jgi:hypothetical protein
MCSFIIVVIDPDIQLFLHIERASKLGSIIGGALLRQLKLSKAFMAGVSIKKGRTLQ